MPPSVCMPLPWPGRGTSPRRERQSDRGGRSWPATTVRVTTPSGCTSPRHGWADPAEANESLAQVEDFAAGSGLPYRRVLAALSGLALHARLGHASEVDRAFVVAEREVHGLPEPGLLELLLEGFRTAAQLLDEPSEALNPQEVVMLKLLAGGATRSQIAHETSYSVNTVKAYLRSAYRKLGVADREQAVAAAVALDIVDAASVAHREDRAQLASRPGPPQ